MADPNERTPATRNADASRAPKQGRGGQRKPAEQRSFDGGAGQVEGYLGAGTPANVDIHKLGQSDRPEEEWGEAGAPEATFSSNHTRRGERTEAVRGQGGKTRRANKDIVSRRS